MTTELSKVMEATAKQELQGRLGLQRPVPLDSTAGVSLSGLASSTAIRVIQSDSALIEAAAMPENSLREVLPLATPLLEPITVVDLSQPDEVLPQALCSSVAEMVFHVMHASDSQRQDIIALRDIVDPRSGGPSWFRLVGLLKDDSSIGFKDGECLMVDDRIRITNERQFLACLQYLHNAMVLNSEVFVYCRNHAHPKLLGSVEQGRRAKMMDS
jgi:hypothetical protein